MAQDKERVKKTLLLDNYTVKVLKAYGEQISGSSNISSAVRTMTREYAKEFGRNKEIKLEF